MVVEPRSLASSGGPPAARILRMAAIWTVIEETEGVRSGWLLVSADLGGFIGEGNPCPQSKPFIPGPV